MYIIVIDQKCDPLLIGGKHIFDKQVISRSLNANHHQQQPYKQQWLSHVDPPFLKISGRLCGETDAQAPFFHRRIPRPCLGLGTA